MNLTASSIGGTTASTEPHAPAMTARSRIRDIDLLRGLVVVLMALDHVRDYFYSGAFSFSPLDPDQTHLMLYATRWVTHLCAPVFVFLAGTAAFLRAAKDSDAHAGMPRYLLVRGLWLIGLELTVISFGWAFALPYPLFLQVIWAIGCSMIFLAGMMWLPRQAILAVGVAIIVGHNLLDPLAPQHFGQLSLLWQFLHEGGLIRVGGMPVGIVSYPVLPWVGVMAVGYGLGPLFLRPPAARNRALLRIGAGMLLAFLLLRCFNLYGDPRPWEPRGDAARTAMAFLDVDKYPPSLMYVLVTLGSAFLLLPLLSRLRNSAGDVLAIFGSVPLFFYVLHLYLVHGLAIIANAALGRDVSGLFNFFVKMTSSPERYLDLGFPLVGVYAAWIVVVAAMYPLCRWWGRIKNSRYRYVKFL